MTTLIYLLQFLDCFSWQQLIELGQNQSDRLLVGSENCQAVNDCAMLIYTSGTTGPPKGRRPSVTFNLLFHSFQLFLKT